MFILIIQGYKPYVCSTFYFLVAFPATIILFILLPQEYILHEQKIFNCHITQKIRSSIKKVHYHLTSYHVRSYFSACVHLFKYRNVMEIFRDLVFSNSLGSLKSMGYHFMKMKCKLNRIQCIYSIKFKYSWNKTNLLVKSFL